MPTRQQRRAKARAPIKRKRRGQMAFMAVLVAVLLGGGAATALLRSNPPPLTRGAIQGEHWHATYRIDICGKRLNPYPQNEGEIHTHGDGKIHIHPSTPAFTLANANLGKFLQGVETDIGQEGAKSYIRFPNGDKYQDGGTCATGGKPEKLVVELNHKQVKGSAFGLVLHDGDDVYIRFGPAAKGQATANPLQTPAATPAPATPAATPKKR
jgi:hypothetical protein